MCVCVTDVRVDAECTAVAQSEPGRGQRGPPPLWAPARPACSRLQNQQRSEFLLYFGASVFCISRCLCSATTGFVDWGVQKRSNCPAASDKPCPSVLADREMRQSLRDAPNPRFVGAGPWRRPSFFFWFFVRPDGSWLAATRHTANCWEVGPRSWEAVPWSPARPFHYFLLTF